MARIGFIFLLLFAAASIVAEELVLHVDYPPGTNRFVVLKGPDARQQLLATWVDPSGVERDVTRDVVYEASPITYGNPNVEVVRVSRNGVITPLADGIANVTAKTTNGLSGSLVVRVEAFSAKQPINFANQIVPIFTKTGCNAGGCHGKSGGQNGFRLSLLGFEPTEDYEHLVKEARGRRLFPAAPEASLLLQKATAMMPHGGGKRIDIGSDDYKLIARWMRQGMPYGKTNDPTVARIEVHPKQRTFTPIDQSRAREQAVAPPLRQQQLVVLAHYTDGTVEDVTRSALYEPNDKDMARVSETGHVELFQQPGDVAVMVRYQAKVAVFRATIPLGAPVEKLPVAKNFVDELVFAKLKTVGMPPSDICDDATFLRRAALDIAGRLPTADETAKFLADTNSDKRDKWVDQLLDSPEYAEYFANKWSALLRNKRTDGNHRRGTYGFYNWIRDGLYANKPFDQFVREILAASGDMAHTPPVAWYRQARETTTQLEDTAQLFLGQRLQCAQCHHHPFEKWSQQDYYNFAAFFSQVGRKGSGQPGEELIFVKRTAPSATNKKTKQPVKPAGLGAPVLELSADDDARLALAEWMISNDNRFFARSLANRYWKHFFNRGLVDPEDDMRETNPPTNPELLDALAKHFVASSYNLKELVRTIARSTAYQLSSVPNEHNAVDKQNFSRYYPRRLPAEALLDAINVVTKSDNKFEGLPRGTRAMQLPDNAFNASTYFLTVFGRPDSSTSCECERSQDASLAQSLHLLNSKDVQEKISHDKGAAALLAADAKTSDDEKVKQLYLAAFSRQPNESEIAVAKGHLERAKDDKAKRQAYEDMVWALINTKEFLFNH